MTLRCEGSPSRLPDKTRDDIRRLDRIIFKGSPRVELEGAWWWIVRDEEGSPIAFCGMRTAVMGCHAGMAYMVRSGVLKAHRGQGIQKRMIKARCALAKRYGFSAVVTYVMDWNLASSNSLISCGFKFYKPQVKYYGDDVLYFQRKFSSVG